MKAGRKKQVLTDKESAVMQILWEHGPMFVKQMVELYPEPRPHVNTISTIVRILEDKGYVGHETVGGSYRYHAAVEIDEFRERSLADVIRNYFNNSYSKVVSALVAEEKISVEELKEIIDMVERQDSDKKKS